MMRAALLVVALAACSTRVVVEHDLGAVGHYATGENPAAPSSASGAALPATSPADPGTPDAAPPPTQDAPPPPPPDAGPLPEPDASTGLPDAAVAIWDPDANVPDGMAWDYLVDAYLPVVVADSAPPPLPYDAGTCSGSAPAPACVSALAYCLAPLPTGATVRELSVLVPSTVTVTGGYAPGGLCPAAFELRVLRGRGRRLRRRRARALLPRPGGRLHAVHRCSRAAMSARWRWP